jgi:hypothetical protein
LVDLGMVELNPDPDAPDFDASAFADEDWTERQIDDFNQCFRHQKVNSNSCFVSLFLLQSRLKWWSLKNSYVSTFTWFDVSVAVDTWINLSSWQELLVLVIRSRNWVHQLIWDVRQYIALMLLNKYLIYDYEGVMRANVNKKTYRQKIRVWHILKL